MGLACYLTFNGQCEEAMNFYARCLGTQINELHRFSDMPGGEVSEECKNQIMHANLSYKGTVLMASDSPPEMGYDGVHKGYAISVNVDNIQDAETVFAALSEGANVTMPTGEQFWAWRFGMLTDKYGIDWMVNCEKEAS